MTSLKTAYMFAARMDIPAVEMYNWLEKYGLDFETVNRKYSWNQLSRMVRNDQKPAETFEEAVQEHSDLLDDIKWA